MYKVRWSGEDGEWVATSDAHEFLSWLSDTPVKALEGLLNVIAEDDLDAE